MEYTGSRFYTRCVCVCVSLCVSVCVRAVSLCHGVSLCAYLLAVCLSLSLVLFCDSLSLSISLSCCMYMIYRACMSCFSTYMHDQAQAHVYVRFLPLLPIVHDDFCTQMWLWVVPFKALCCCCCLSVYR